MRLFTAVESSPPWMPSFAEWGGPVLFFIAPPKSLETAKKSRGLRAARIESYLLHELHPIIIIFRVFTTPIPPPCPWSFNGKAIHFVDIGHPPALGLRPYREGGRLKMKDWSQSNFLWTERPPSSLVPSTDPPTLAERIAANKMRRDV